MANNTTTTLSHSELMAFTLPILPLAVIGIVDNSVIVYMYVRYKTLRAEGGFHMMALLAVCDLLNSATHLQASFLLFSRQTFSLSSQSTVCGSYTQRRSQQYCSALQPALFGRT